MKLGLREHEDWRKVERRLRVDRDSRQKPSLPYVSCLDEDDQGNPLTSSESRSYQLKTLQV